MSNKNAFLRMLGKFSRKKPEPDRPASLRRTAAESEFDECIKLIAEKKINVTKYIDDLVSLDKAQESFERLTSGKDAAVKIIFKP